MAVADEAAAVADFVVLPERMREVRGSRVAPFRREVQELRAHIRESDHTVALAVPEGAETAAYQEHAAGWVLPIVLFATDIPLGVACNLFANWIWSRVGPEPEPDDTVYVRLARELPDGTLEMLEARGKVEDVIRVLREPELESGRRIDVDLRVEALKAFRVALIEARHKCSICGAGDFQCDHIEGVVYDGVPCEWEQTDIWIDHVAVTQNPDFTYTFHNSIPRSRRESDEELGERWEEGEDALLDSLSRLLREVLRPTR